MPQEMSNIMNVRNTGKMHRRHYSHLILDKITTATTMMMITLLIMLMRIVVAVVIGAVSD